MEQGLWQPWVCDTSEARASSEPYASGPVEGDQAPAQHHLGDLKRGSMNDCCAIAGMEQDSVLLSACFLRRVLRRVRDDGASVRIKVRHCFGGTCFALCS